MCWLKSSEMYHFEVFQTETKNFMRALFMYICIMSVVDIS